MRAEPFRWIARGEPFHTIGSGSSAEFPAILEHLILQRGLPVGDRLESFLRPRLADLADPFLIPGMRAAVERILLAVDRGERVCIFGDYDVDGVTSIAIMRRILRSYGLEPRHFIPRRGSEGYGLNRAALERCMKEGPKPDLLIAVDCGTVSVQEVAELNEKGVDVVIVDHHEPAEELPAAVAVVNPKRGDDFTYLCAAGVAFKVGHALLKTRQVPLDLKELLDLVAVATIADIVPMVGENRLLVRHGLRHLPGTLNPGLRALQEVTGMNGHATSMDVGFRIGPRLNAAGRMDVPEDALETLITDCRRLAMDLALKLDDYNRARQEHENLIRRQALEQLQRDFVPNRDPVIVIGSREWHPGVVGIVASRLMRQYHKPTFVIAIDGDGIGKGSGRSIEGVSLVEAIRACGDDLLAGGGHAMAAGLSIEEARLPSFRDRFADYVRRNTNEEQLRPTLYYDAEISFGQLCLEFMDSYDLLQPFGNGNPQPVFISRGISLSRPPVRMKNQHLRFMLRQGYHEQDAVFFGGGEKALPDPPWDVAFTIDRNTFRGRTTLQLIVQDVRGAVPA
ncbi:single-stranded-DNA-specific exonuclease RecJ [Luteolibacter sp. SL250]|uniref:single-stranded-DNA-specific exonuclease RecJ n=1 Tax=Luteolibacter sp. SL250 TaxID=2995170 RepID=UPI00226FE3AE|nr:single-stranded-DNA-specific exonuclease RecJ [Luteolibacter sp. SL250]WAC21044.1 single-stranded-DNA-specific exonuclease RecJ [Luteolibacter sp. SL250]